MNCPVPRFWVLALGAALLGCPPVPAPDAPPTGTRTACTPGLAFCDDNIARLCGDNGYVADRVICEDTQTCVLGSCEDNLVCTPGAFVCVRNELVRCNADGTALSSRQDCGQDFCVDGACVPAAGVCPAGQAYCDGNRAALCNGDGSGTVGEPVACGSEAVCLGGQCLPVVCEAGESSCDGNLARTCDLWGTGYTVQASCTGGAVCVRGRCQTLVCEPGLATCQGNRVVVCSDDGTAVIDQRDCGSERVCQGGRCVVDAVDAGGWDQGGRDAAVLDRATPDRASPDQARPDTAWPDSARPDATRPDVSVADSARPDTFAPDTAPPTCDGIDDGYEPDDSRAEATPIASSTTLTGLVACDEFDWFKVEVPSGRMLRATIEFTNSVADLDLAVFRNSETAEFDESATTADSETVELWNAPATASLRVFNYDYPNKVGAYTLTTALVDPPVCGDGVVNGDEYCDTLIASGNVGACPTSCTDSGCFHYTLTGAGSCWADCEPTRITACNSSDGCCPDGCTSQNDQQCADQGLTPCSSDSNCPADRYCDLQRLAPACRVGCRLGTSTGCATTHHCASDHRCVLNTVLPHQRCAPCSDSNPCASGFDCHALTQLCSPTCSLFTDDCATTVGTGAVCDLLLCIIGPCVCAQDDCP